MAMTDPIGDMIARIRNGQHARLSEVTVQASRFRSDVLDVLKREGFIRNFEVTEVCPGVGEI
ncbi:MAG: 30S ribosomal protein S8, partial [Alphaproteobacteria bacterium]|nr:30S ribosomal protein S8 [Alphaproteobacteria bacterium]